MSFLLDSFIYASSAFSIIIAIAIYMILKEDGKATGYKGLLPVIFSIVVLTLAFSYFYISPKTYNIAITEFPPWFSPAVIKINVGDTIKWIHEETPDVMKASFSPFEIDIFPVVMANEGHSNQHTGHIHTHPIMSLQGPENFSSNFEPVDEFSFTFNKPGIYVYICPTHPYMKGIIAVGVNTDQEITWPPKESTILDPPKIPGIGEIWVDTQFEVVVGQKFPGTITVIDANTWKVKKTIIDTDFNNPHNLWNSIDGDFIYQTQWHSNKLSKIDVDKKSIVGTIDVGIAPAHVFVHPTKDKIYVTLNDEDKVIVVNSSLQLVNSIKTPLGPHGLWIEPSGKYMSVAATLSGELAIIDLEKEEVIKTFDVGGLPLASSITPDGKYAAISSLLNGKVVIVDLRSMEIVKDINVGSMPIQVVPSPDGKYFFVANTGSSDVSVIDTGTLDMVKTLPAFKGAHGITFGKKEGGGYYAYVSNKYARAVVVIDVDSLDVAGHIKLSDNGWGGNGILALPNTATGFWNE